MIGNVADEVQSDEAEDVDIDDDQPMNGWLQRIARVSLPVIDMGSSTWSAPVPATSSFDDTILLRPEEIASKRVAMVRTLKNKVDHKFFFLDSGASVHCVPNADYLSSVTISLDSCWPPTTR